MSKNQWRKVSLGIGPVVGILADGYLRLISGDEGNLLVHTMVFLGSALIVDGVVYGSFLLWDMFFHRKMWCLSLIVISVITVIWTVCNIMGIKLSDTVIRIMGVLDICAIPVLVYTSIKKKDR